jgi:hypothetical protein
MTRHLLVSTAVAAVLAVSTIQPVRAQDTTPVVAAAADEDSRLQAAAQQRGAADQRWSRSIADGFGQTASMALGDWTFATSLALDPVFAAYAPVGPEAPKTLPDAIAALTAAITPKQTQAMLNAAPLPKRAAGPGEPVTMETRDIGNGITENRYYMMLMTQTFDGTFERSHSQKAGFARLRNADESWVKIDYGDGALVIREPARLGMRASLSTGRFVNTTGTEVAIAYDYRTNAMRGNPRTAAYHNTYIRPLMAGMPPLGSDVAWTVSLSAAKLGVAKAQSGDFAMEVKRTYFSHAGAPYVILEYSVPDFTYGNALGEKVVHRARGVALADPAMGQIYWNTSLQTAETSEAGGRTRPYRYARTGFAMDAKGQPLLDLAAIPEMKPYLDSFYNSEATAPLPVIGARIADQTPVEIASKIDMAGFALGENSGNQLVEAIGSYSNGETGAQVGAGIDYEINNVIQPALGAIAISTGIVFEQNVQQILSAATRTIGEIEALRARAAIVQSQTRSISAALTAQNLRIAALTEKIYQQVVNGENYATAMKTLTELDVARFNSGQLMGQLRDVALRVGSYNLEIVKLQNAVTNVGDDIARVAASPIAREGSVANALMKLNSMLSAQKALSAAFNGIGLAANLAGIAKNMSLLASFDPHQSGELALNGNYSGWGIIAEPALFMLATAGDFASGNITATVLDLTNFIGGRFGDVYMSWQSVRAANVDAQIAFMEEVRTGLRSAAQNQRNIDTLISATGNLGSRITALQQEASTNTAQSYRPGGVNDPNWSDPRFDARTGRPIPSYWAYLKANSPETLVRMGIDPDAPVGGWPNGVRPQDRPRTQTAQQTTQPRQPGGPDYPTAPARTRPNTPTPPREPTLEEIAAGGSTSPARTPPTPYTPPPRPPARDDRIYVDESPITQTATSSFDITPVTFDPVTFQPNWTPVTWTAPTWTPPTWTPPTWTPPRFDAPRASDIDWTDLGVGRNWPQAIDNMAFEYGDMSGQVATDLSEYEEWLATQNQTYLEQLARTAGYPNLASALQDSASLIRKANDPAFYTWAWSPPAVSGAIGIQFSEGQHEMGRAAYMLGDLLKLSGLFSGEGGARQVAGEEGLDDPSLQSLNGRGRNAFGGPDDANNAALASAAYRNFQLQADPTGRWGRESGGRLAASLLDQGGYLRQTTANGLGGLTALLAQPFNVVLTWGAGAFDLDLHMTGPLGAQTTNRFHIYYAATGNLTAQPFAALIRDCICNSGSEVVLTSALNSGGVYRVSVFNFGDQSASSTNLANASQATIQIVRGGTTQAVGNGTTIVGGRNLLTVTAPSGQPGNTWVAAEINPNNGRITVPRAIVQSEGSGNVR